MNSLEAQQNNASAVAKPPSKPITSAPQLKLRLVVAILVVLLALTVLAGLIPRWRRQSILSTETRELAISTVAVVSPVPGTNPEGLTLPAEVKSFIETPIYARANGYLKRWLVDLGAQVEAGQLLAEIETPEVNQDLARTRAELAEAQAALALAKTTATRWAELLKTASVSEQEHQ